MKKNIYLNIFLCLATIFCLSACVNQKQIAYFQKAPNQPDTIAVAKAFIPKIQAGDILSIMVGSLNPMASSFFNPYASMPVSTTPTAGQPVPGSSAAINTVAPSLVQTTAPGYLVDATGAIEMPIIGTLYVGGLTTMDAKELIKKKVATYLKESTVSVRFLNYKISVLGEVVRPSVYVIPNETITLPEALGLAGDMTIYGKRENVLVIRDENGKKIFGRVDLTTREVYNSPYYYLHENDIVYVEPGKGRIAQTDKVYQLLPVVLSALSLISVIFIYSRK